MDAAAALLQNAARGARGAVTQDEATEAEKDEATEAERDVAAAVLQGAALAHLSPKEEGSEKDAEEESDVLKDDPAIPSGARMRQRRGSAGLSDPSPHESFKAGHSSSSATPSRLRERRGSAGLTEMPPPADLSVLAAAGAGPLEEEEEEMGEPSATGTDTEGSVAAEEQDAVEEQGAASDAAEEVEEVAEVEEIADAVQEEAGADDGEANDE